MSEKVRPTGLLTATLLGMVFLAMPGDAKACGDSTDCRIGERTYRIRMPEGHDGKEPVGAIVFMHGYRGSAKGVMRNQNLGRAVSELGLALVAPKSAYEDWAIPGSPAGRQPVELEYFDALVSTLKQRHNIDTTRLMASGFSAGGMMTWNLACDRGGLFAGFAPIAGTFWEPTPKTCASKPVNLIHTHGAADKVVPLSGRKIGPTKQGNVRQVLNMYSIHGAFKETGNTVNSDLKLECQVSKNAKGQLLEFCLHPDGHSLRTGYVTRAWNRFVELGIMN